MKKLETKGIEIYSWCPDIEQSALDQMIHLATLPFVKHCALMPDAHLGQNMPIGGVIGCDNVVIPDSVGADIGCGMCAMLTSLTLEDVESEHIRKKLLHSFSRSIPVGFQHNSEKRIINIGNTYEHEIHDLERHIIQKTHSPIDNIRESIYSQLGTLGGGNHFLEMQCDEQNRIWVMIHSGSRNIGKKVGDYFNDIASKLNKSWYSKSDIPFLPVDTDEGKSYLEWMNFALNFAYLNRKVMMDCVKHDLVHEFANIHFGEMINIHHNFAALESHMGKNLWVHRKGATRAYTGQLGIIPGSMGTNSYIVSGKGERLSLMSCSHGAGRKMGRKEFCRQMETRQDEIEKSLQGVIHSDFGKVEYGKGKGLRDISEAPQAYKDIDAVIANEMDLIETVVKLRPLMCMKG